MRATSVVAGALVAGFLLPAPAPAAEPPAAQATASDAPRPSEHRERGTPQDAMRGYLEAGRAGDWERAAGYLDLRHLAPGEAAAQGPRLARQLKIVLDQRLWVDVEALSAEPGGATDDGLPALRDRVGEIETPRGRVPVWLQRVSGDEDDAVWKIASSTVERVPALWQAYGPPPLVERLPAWLVGVRVGETAPWQWLALALLAPVAIGLAWLAVLALAALARPLARRTRTDFDDRLVRATSRPLRLAAAIGAFHLATLPLGLALPVRRGLASVEGALLVIALIWFALRVVNLLTLMVIRRLEERGNPAARAAVPLGQRAAKAVVLVIGAIALLDGFGFDVTALVAGLGVGGIAVALAAQKSMENLFGGVTLLADRPVAVGDFCRFGERLGFVESIGLRSTRVRTLERTLVTVPNADFSTLQIENYGARDRMWYHPTLGLRYETTPDQLRHVLVGIRRLLYAHPMVDPDPARVRFVGFGAYSLDLEVFAYVRTRDFAEYLEVAEDLNLRIMDLVEASGSGFAFPSQTLYLGRDDGLDEKRAREAEEQVRAWRERRELYLPRFPERAIAELDDTLDWPPAGAPEPAR